MGVYVRYGRTEGCVCEVWEDRGGVYVRTERGVYVRYGRTERGVYVRYGRTEGGCM